MKQIQHISWRARLYIVTALMLVMSNNAFSQAIQVLNIPDFNGSAAPQPSGRSNDTGVRPNGTPDPAWADYGYHLNGTRGYTGRGGAMVDAKAKLINSANFGTSGIVNRPLTINDGFGTKGSITNISQLQGYDIIYIGAYIRLANSGSPFTDAEIAILLNWSKQAGKVLMVQEQGAYVAGTVANPISTQMGYGITGYNPSPPTSVLPADTEQNTKVFSGVFGSVTGTGTISQAGESQGYFSSGCAGIPLAGNGAFGSFLLNQEYRDILVSDTDFFTYLSGTGTQMSSGSGISTNADKVWANLWAWAVNEVVNQVAPSTNVTLGGEAYSDDLPICTGTASITVKLRNNNAPVLRWQTSTDGGNTYTNIANTTSTLVYNNPVSGQMFRAVVKNVYPTCTETTSTALTVTVNNTAPTVATSLTSVCPATTVNLADAQTSTAPSGMQWVWFNNNGHSGSPLTAAQIANAGAGTYYAYYQSTSNATCFSPSSSAVTVNINSCTICNAGTSQVPLNGNTLSN